MPNQPPALISVLIPERSRPEMLERCIASLIETAGTDRGIEILIAVDRDDPAYADLDAPKPWERFRFGEVRVQAWLWDRPLTLGEKLNMLAAEARGDVLWFVANDYTMETLGWPAKFRAACARLPNGIGVPFPHDDLHPDHAAFPIITRAMQQAVGFAFPPCYGIGWFTDTHIDEIGILLGQHFEIDVTVRSQGERGATHGMVDLSFWVQFFRAIAPLRLQEATRAAEIAYGRASPQFHQMMADITRRQQLCAARVAHLSTPEFLARWSDRSASPPAPRYPEVKAYAERMMAEIKKGTPKRLRVAIAVPSGRTWEATTATCVAAVMCHSAMAGIECCLINVQTSMPAHMRNVTVQMALDQDCDFCLWIDSDMTCKPDTLVNLLRHNKSIVGATYNRRVPPFGTLGRLKGPHPGIENLMGGLCEAEFLPGGMLLVKMDVYKAMKWPWYYEAYRWDEVEHVDAFKAMMRDYYRTQPPEGVLEGFEDTKLGQWIAANGDVGVDGGPADRMTSEDINWSKKARRAGFEIWCCLDTTFDTGHIGEKVITCDRPDLPAEKMAAD